MTLEEMNRRPEGDVDSAKVKPARGREGTDWNAQRWVSAHEAAELLDRVRNHVCLLGRQGKLSVYRPHPSPGVIWFAEAELADYAAQGEERLAKRLVRRELNPYVWGSRQVPQPLPEGDEWIPTKEAAAILGVSRGRALFIARRGLLPVRQAREFRTGMRVEFSRYFTSALAVRRRAEKERKARDRAERAAERAARGDEEKEYPSGWTRPYRPVFGGRTIEAADLREPSPATRKDRGEFYTVRQAAMILEAAPRGVRSMIARGRLKAERKPQHVRKNRFGVLEPTKGNRWWFIRKEEVDRLLADPEYRRDHRKGKAFNTPEGREAAMLKRYEQEKLSEEDLLAWERVRAFGKPPLCEPWRNPLPFDIDWDPRIFWTPPITHDPASPPGFGFTPEDFIDW